MNINASCASINGLTELTVKTGGSQIDVPNVKHAIGMKEGWLLKRTTLVDDSEA
jgi:hypothetical protein